MYQKLCINCIIKNGYDSSKIKFSKKYLNYVTIRAKLFLNIPFETLFLSNIFIIIFLQMLHP